MRPLPAETNSSGDAARKHVQQRIAGCSAVRCNMAPHFLFERQLRHCRRQGVPCNPWNCKRVLEGWCHIYSGDTMLFYATLRMLNGPFIHQPVGAPCVVSFLIFTVQCSETTKKRELNALQSGGKTNVRLRDGVHYWLLGVYRYSPTPLLSPHYYNPMYVSQPLCCGSCLTALL